MWKSLRTKCYWLMLLALPFLLGIETCGISQFLTGETENNSPTELCLDLIPTPTFVPITAPLSQNTPAPQGTPIIVDGEVVGDPTPILLPRYTVTARAVRRFCLPPPSGGTLTISPSGVFGVSTDSVTFSFSYTGFCFSIEVFKNGVPLGFISWTSTAPYSVNISGDTTIEFRYD